ncbi:MAG: hypothetical protein ISS20_21320 [Acidovorax sp.]|nr:hypothetical protein [Acidovorax sp.]
MISKKAIVALVLIVSASAFAVGAYVYQHNALGEKQAVVISQSEHLVRMHSPVLVTLPLFRVVLNPRFTRPFCAVPRTSVVRTASG